MTAVLQRVLNSSVTVDGETVGSCENGLLILLGVFEDDDEKDAELLALKISKLRIFNDGNKKMNLSVNDIHGSCLVISNFSLCANYKHGNRPDYLSAKKPEEAERLYLFFTERLRSLVDGGVQTGVFGAEMYINNVCEGPITIVMDSKVLRQSNRTSSVPS